MPASAPEDPRPTSGPAGRRFWFIELAPGVLPRHFGTLLYGAFTSIGLLAFVAIGTPYVLNVYLQVPASEQGQITGDLAAWTEIALLLIFGPAGILADRIGRRQVYAVGYVFMGIGYLLYPLAGSVAALTGYRMVYALGVGLATAMLQTTLADYPENNSRGKASAIVGMLNGLGVVILSVGLGGLMKSFVSNGWDPAMAGYLAHGVVAGLCFLSAVVVARGLQPGTGISREQRLSVGELVHSGLAAARNPRIAFAYACAFIARGDMVVVGAFVNLWGTHAAMAAGHDPAVASAEGRMLFVIATASGLFWLPIMGYLLDRVNRVSGALLGMALAAAGFMFTDLVDDPLARSSLPFFLLLGIGQISAFAAAATLISQEAPRESRGAVIGLYNMSGAVGILFSTAVGGRLFDAIGPHAVFEMIGTLTVLVVLFGLWVRWKAPGPLSPRGRGAGLGH
ncbi:MAG: MFS transporter [Gammaproteobacteria bacterium]|nr:MFS transporter [Gammaproteobacteria bacterium]